MNTQTHARRSISTCCIRDIRRHSRLKSTQIIAPKAWIRGQVPEDRIRCTSFAGPSPKYDLLKYRVLICRPETRPAAQVALLSPQSVKLQKKEEYCQRKGSKGTRPSSASRPWLHENNCLSEYTHYTVVIFSRCLPCYTALTPRHGQIRARARRDSEPASIIVNIDMHSSTCARRFCHCFYVSSYSFWSIYVEQLRLYPVRRRRFPSGGRKPGWDGSDRGMVTQRPAHTECALCSHFGGSALMCAMCMTDSETNICETCWI